MSVVALPIVVRFHAGAVSLPKHVRLREAIVGAVESGDLPTGAKVVGERELSEVLGLSLGTIQKALGQLMHEGFLVRRQGHGTFVGSHRRPIAGSWHCRFVAPEGGPELPVFATVVERRLIRQEGVWSEVLGFDSKGYVMVRRRLDVSGKFVCASQIYLQATRFSRLLRMAQKRLVDINLKTILAEDFSAPTLHSEGLVTLVTLDAEDTDLMNVVPGTAGLQVHIVGRSFGRVPITFQRMAVPPTRYAMKLDFNQPSARSDDAKF